MSIEKNDGRYLNESDVFAQDGHIDGPFAHRLGLPEDASDIEYRKAVDRFYGDHKRISSFKALGFSEEEARYEAGLI